MDGKIKSLFELQDVALNGCESAAKIYQTHSKRPYFKKIDLLCDRLKQDLTVTNKAVININSHGIAWAIKDFIFVFNRIISAWIILRDYNYCTSEGMSCVKGALNPEFEETFLAWQEATTKMSKVLIQSFESLHVRDQRNGNRKTGSAQNSPANNKANTDPFQRMFDPLIVENSNEAQLSGAYLKSAVYRPLSSSEGSTSPPDTPGSSSDQNDYEAFKLLVTEICNDDDLGRSGNPKPLYKRGEASQSRKKTNLSNFY